MLCPRSSVRLAADTFDRMLTTIKRDDRELVVQHRFDVYGSPPQAMEPLQRIAGLRQLEFGAVVAVLQVQLAPVPVISIFDVDDRSTEIRQAEEQLFLDCLELAAFDFVVTRVFVEADSPRVACRTHGPTVVQVPWARHAAGHTRDFDEMAAWLAVCTSKSAACQLLRVAWRTIGAIVTRVNSEVEARVDRLDGLRRIGIDEISYKRGHRYLIVVVDHDTGRLVWAGPGRSEAALDVFFVELGEERVLILR